MRVARSRDVPSLTREALLDDYVARAKGNYSTLAATALRTRSLGLRDILVHGALRSSVSAEALKSQLLKNKILLPDNVADVDALAELGRVVLLQNLLPDDEQFGEMLLTAASEFDSNSQLTSACRRVLVQHHISQKNDKRARRLLDKWPDIDKQGFGYLRAELLNPFTRNQPKYEAEWLEAFNRPFLHYGITPVALSNGEARFPFDRLQPAETLTCIGPQGPLVSVVLTVFRPLEEQLLTSVRSILDQTWRNLELIIVDDSSGPEYKDIFDRIRELDSRIMLIHAPKNRGTYIARNIGYAASNGQFITGQDDDDWSHPERIERQVKFLENNPNRSGCRVDAVRCDNHLQRVRVGYSPKGQNASSLMIRRDAYDLAGDFLPARKAADTEYHLRVERITGQSIATIREPLSIIRILPSSLSRGDFAPAWKHASRTSFRSAYEYWHRSSEAERLHVGGGRVPPVKIPVRFQVDTELEREKRLDVVIATHWNHSGDYSKVLLEEVRALLAKGYSVGIMNMESPLEFRKRIQASLDDGIQELINQGLVEEVFLDDEVGIKLLVVRHVPILQFLNSTRSSLKVDSLVIGADISPAETDGNNIVYRIEDCAANAKTTFGRDPIWIPWSTGVRESLSKYIDPAYISNSDFPRVINPNRLAYNRLWYRSRIPLVGYYATDAQPKRMEALESLRELQKYSDDYDIREWRNSHPISGDAAVEAEVTSNLYYTAGEMRFEEFLNSIDYMIFDPDPKVANVQFEVSVMKALEAGIIVILPETYRSVYGNAAVYAGPGKVNEVISDLHRDFKRYQGHLSRAFETLSSMFNQESFVRFLARALAEQRI